MCAYMLFTWLNVCRMSYFYMKGDRVIGFDAIHDMVTVHVIIECVGMCGPEGHLHSMCMSMYHI